MQQPPSSQIKPITDHQLHQKHIVGSRAPVTTHPSISEENVGIVGHTEDSATKLPDQLIQVEHVNASEKKPATIAISSSHHLKDSKKHVSLPQALPSSANNAGM